MKATTRQPKLLTTREAAASIGVSEATIKRWADSGVLACERTPGGHRKFRAVEVERVAAGLRGDGPSSAPAEVASEPLVIDAETVKRLALQGDAVALHGLAEGWMKAGGRLDALFDLVLQPALERVGELWESGAVTVADEHTASAAVGEVVDRLAVFVDRRPLRGAAISACLEGEHHALGARMAALILRDAGFHALAPGSDTPLDSLLSLIESADARVVCLSASSLLAGDASLPARLAPVLATASSRRAVVFVGGSAFAPPFETPAPARYLSDMRSLSVALERPHA